MPALSYRSPGPQGSSSDLPSKGAPVARGASFSSLHSFISSPNAGAIRSVQEPAARSGAFNGTAFQLSIHHISMQMQMQGIHDHLTHLSLLTNATTLVSLLTVLMAMRELASPLLLHRPRMMAKPALLPPPRTRRLLAGLARRTETKPVLLPKDSTTKAQETPFATSTEEAAKTDKAVATSSSSGDPLGNFLDRGGEDFARCQGDNFGQKLLPTTSTEAATSTEAIATTSTEAATDLRPSTRRLRPRLLRHVH
ncbi:hypothetical protein C8F04DRAFT_1391772 [Mycena alexandri]|uniref:Uncharacterized protein n=1 Tax=Mycena alexandri TaxID=1745969 RepID=A0AAD6X892_9AGAR|nr:hypothetical protein C8F04DRAFT_1391772 [Mycena alexandri]